MAQKWIRIQVTLLLGLGVLVLGQGGCASTPKARKINPSLQESSPKVSRNLGQAGTSPSKMDRHEDMVRSHPLPQLSFIPAERKTGLIIPETPKRISKQESNNPRNKHKVLFNFDKADIAEVTNEIFARFLKLNYVLDPTVQGRISLYLEGEYSNKELLSLVKRTYNANNLDVILRNGLYHIQPIHRSTKSSLPIASEVILKGEKGISPVIVIYRPRYLSAIQMVKTIKAFLTPGRPIVSDPMTNSIIFVEDADNAKTILDLVKALDVDLFKEIGMEVIKLKTITPEEAIKGVETILNKLSTFQHSFFKDNIAFMPLDKLGGVLVIAPDNEALSFVKRWLKAIDVKGRETGEQIKIYFIENGLAKDIAKILEKIFGISEGSATERLEQKVIPQAEVTTASKSPGTAQKKALGASLSGPVTIIADEANNAIVVKANAIDQEKIKATIKALDIVPRQVLIEMLLVEVTLNNEINYGVEWFLKNKGMNIGSYKGKYSVTLDYGTSFNKNFDLGTVTSSGLSLYWGSIKGDIASLISFLSSKTDVRVLSTPTLLATDNQEATITVGGSEPVITQQSQNTAGENIITSVQCVETGIILKVKPHINSGGLVRMEVEQTIREAEKNTISGIDSPRFTERKVQTTLIAKDGQTIIIGGII